MGQVGYYTGMIVPWAVPWAPEPENWMLCQGQLLPIWDERYQELYSLIGTKFGGDGRNNFALPDLRTRVPIGAGQGAGLSPYALGQTGGAKAVALTLNQMPAHAHTVDLDVEVHGSLQSGAIRNGQSRMEFQMPVNATSQEGNLVPAPTANTCLGVARTFDNKAVNLYSTGEPDVRLMNGMAAAAGTASGDVTGSIVGSVAGQVSLAKTGSGIPMPVTQPYLMINYIICIKGLHPYNP